MIEVEVVVGALRRVSWVWICTLRMADVERVTRAASAVFGRLMLQVPDPASDSQTHVSQLGGKCFILQFFDPRGRDTVFWITQLCRRNWSGLFPTFADSFAFFCALSALDEAQHPSCLMPGSDCEIFLSPRQISAINHCWVFVWRPATLWVRPWRRCLPCLRASHSAILLVNATEHVTLGRKIQKNHPRRPRLSNSVFQLRYCKCALVIPDVNNQIWHWEFVSNDRFA